MLVVEKPTTATPASARVVVNVNESLPSPPFRWSPVVSVVFKPTKLSLPAVPVLTSAPVVSDQISVYGIGKCFNNLINDSISIFIVTYRIPTLAR